MSFVSIGLEVVNVMVLFGFRTKDDSRLFLLSVAGLLFEVLHRSRVVLDVPYACHRIISVFVIVEPKPIEKYELRGTFAMNLIMFLSFSSSIKSCVLSRSNLTYLSVTKVGAVVETNFLRLILWNKIIL